MLRRREAESESKPDEPPNWLQDTLEKHQPASKIFPWICTCSYVELDHNRKPKRIYVFSPEHQARMVHKRISDGILGLFMLNETKDDATQ